MSFLAPADFVGVFEQSVNEFTTPKMQAFIDKHEPGYLRDLLGATEYNSFIADLDTAPVISPSSVPTSAKFTVIFNAFATDDDNTNGCKYVSEGMKEMLKYFLMYEYARDNQYSFALTGATKNTFSNAEIAKLNMTSADTNYNLGIATYRAIQWYICDNPVPYNYDDYNGEKKDYTSWL